MLGIYSGIFDRFHGLGIKYSNGKVDCRGKPFLSFDKLIILVQKACGLVLDNGHKNLEMV